MIICVSVTHLERILSFSHSKKETTKKPMDDFKYMGSALNSNTL